MNKHLQRISSFIICTTLVYTSMVTLSPSSSVVYAIEASDTALNEQNKNNSSSAETTTNQLVQPNKQVLVLTRESNLFTFNGVGHKATQPVTELNGTTYIPLKSIAQLYGFDVSYNSKTKESIAASQQLTLAFKQKSTQVKINNSTIKTIPTTLIISGSLMVPVRAWSELTDSTLTLTDKEIKIEWTVGPSAAFKLNAPSPIFANQTTVNYDDLASSPSGAKIIDEKWTNKHAIFTIPGKYVVTRQVQDETGAWSLPYSVTVEVLPENLPPVAMFTTNKEVYKLGEPITYTDQSTDDYKIRSVTWKDDKPVFFSPGTKTVSIEVLDIYGLKSSYEKQIEVIDEVLYTEEEYYYNFSTQGKKVTISHQLALDSDPVSYVISPNPTSTVVRLNSPEQLSQAGIDYRDTIDAGQVRFAIHKENKTSTSFQLNLVAKNNNDFPVTLKLDSFAKGGPAPYVNQSGKAAVTQFMNNIIHPQQFDSIELQPGESLQVLPEEGLVAIGQNRTLSIFADYSISGPLEFTSAITYAGTDALSQLPTLEQLVHDGKHVRGTFKGADRRLVFTKMFGVYDTERILIGDRVFDSYITGVDAISGSSLENAGNGAVKYAFSLEVLPNTIVLLNGRGGLYAGAILVNNKVVNIADEGYLSNSSEAVVLYRTGDEKEQINFNFLPAPGSNMPLSLVFDKVPAIEVEEINKVKLNHSK